METRRILTERLHGFNQMYLFTDLSVSATVGLRHALIFLSQLLLINTREEPGYTTGNPPEDYGQIRG